MKRTITPLLAALFFLSAGILQAQSAPQFRLGFATLAEQIPGVVGAPVEEEHHGANGDGLQRTTTGLMVWRKADNWTAFTDGYRTWVNGPFGVVERGNDERFEWEFDDRQASPPAASMAMPASPVSRPAPGPASATRVYPRVNVPPNTRWDRSAIFWFGRATKHDNYADVRVYYDAQAFHIYAAVTDYYLWGDASGRGDPRQYDAIALYIDNGVSAGPLGPADYLFVSGFRRGPLENDARWHRQARGGLTGWDYGWSPSPPWQDRIALRYHRSGPNDNSDRDGGWGTTITVPWATLGLSGPPSPGTEWGMGLRLYDRDEPPPEPMVGTVDWPAGFSETGSATWGTVVFDPPAHTAPQLPKAGTTVIRRGAAGAQVKDAYAGGGGTCGGGIFGGGDRPHPTDHLFVQNQSDIADFPCFSKSYLSFSLSQIPAGKKILSATLTLHSFGGSDPSQAQPSQVQLFTVADDWNEATLTWNNAPMALENVAMSTVDVIRKFPGWPGVPTNWDATAAVAEAYAAGKPANLALYSADTAYHSGKYFVSSESGDWNARGRPTLTVTWAD